MPRHVGQALNTPPVSAPPRSHVPRGSEVLPRSVCSHSRLAGTQSVRQCCPHAERGNKGSTHPPITARPRAHVPRGNVFRIFVAGTLPVVSPSNHVCRPLFSFSGRATAQSRAAELRHTECARYIRCLSASLSPGHSARTAHQRRWASSTSPRSMARAARLRRVTCP